MRKPAVSFILASLLIQACVYGQSFTQLLDSVDRYKSSDPGKALLFSEKAYQIALDQKSTASQAKAGKYIGSMHYMQGNHDLALKWYLQAKQLYEQASDSEGIARTLNEMCVLYLKQKKFREADEASAAAVFIAVTLGDRDLMANAYNNRGLRFLDTHQTDSALFHFRRGYDLYKSLNSALGMSYSLDYMASISAEQNRYSEAAAYLQESKTLHEKANDRIGLAVVINNMGELQLQLQNFSEALVHFRKARDEAASLKFKDLEAYTWKMEARVFEQQEKYAEAFTAIKTYQDLHEQMLNEKRIKAIEELQTKYETDKKEQQNKLLLERASVQDLKLSRRNIAIVALVLTALLTAGISLLLYNRYRLRQKAKLQGMLLQQQELRSQAVIEAEEHERQRLGRELHDGVGQLLAIARRKMQTLHETYGITGQADEALAFMDDSIREVRQLSHSMMPPSLRNKTLIRALEELFDRIRHNTDLVINTEWVHAEGLRLDKSQTLMLYRAVQEMMSNILKHSQATEVHVTMVRHEEELTIMVYDNGCGFDKGKTAERGSGLGIKNIRSRIGYIGGRLELDTTPGRGTTYIVELPLKETITF